MSSLVHWKKYCELYCELEQYREPLMKALQVINAHRGCNYVADTRDGEDFISVLFTALNDSKEMKAPVEIVSL